MIATERKKGTCLLYSENIIGRLCLKFGLLLIMFKSMYLSFTWYIPEIAIYAIGLISFVLFMITSRNVFNQNNNNKVLCVFFIIIQFYVFFITLNQSIILMFVLSISTFYTCGILLLNDDIKVELVNFCSKTLGILLLISIPAWILYLLGFSWPHYVSQDCGIDFYIHANYYFFVVSAKPQDIIDIQRFCSFFLEPGHLATTCSFFLFINKFNIKRWEVLLMLVAVILSLSLAGYGLLIGAYIFYLILYNKNYKKYLLAFALLIAGLTVFFMNLNMGNNVINEKIISRLVFEDGEMSGNNRFTPRFESHYHKYLKSDDVYWGILKEFSTVDYKYNWMDGSAGWKRYIIMYGIIGTSLVLIFYLLLLCVKWSYAGFFFFIVFLVANCIRDYPLRQYWLYTYILALPLLQRQYMSFNKQRKLING
ncbi:hypothetical protein AGMMS50262_18870 [Bacteroidia bacterium]|nr:hypothetical protein AGMMS50262_18870 [Bacteroidia bacterium]